jgi:hypothetical protein
MNQEWKSFFQTLWYAFIGISYLIAIVSLGLTFTLIIFASPKHDTTSVTNILFAILAVTANVCFSWARTVNTNSRLFKTIRYTGELGLLSAILFLLASMMKYFTLNLGTPGVMSTSPPQSMVLSFNIVYAIFFVAAYILATFAFGFILRILVPRFLQTKPPFAKNPNSLDDTPPTS